MPGILNLILGGVGVVKDAYFNLVSLLLPGNGTNGAQNNTFLDSSTNNFTITRNGNTTQGTFSPFSQTGWGAYFDGSNDSITSATSSALNLSSGNWTIQGWIYPTAYSAGNNVPIYLGVSGTDKIVIATIGTAGHLYYLLNGSVVITSTTAAPLNSWSYVALVKNGGTTTLYLNGVSLGTTSSVPTSSNKSFVLGTDPGSPAPYSGYMSNFRVLNGTADTAVPTSPFTAITNTSLLICQSNRFVDNSASPITLTPNNGVAITPFSPFAPTAAYTTAAVGGSGYFDGTGDELNAGSNAAFGFGTSAYTVELWVYLTAAVSATHAPCFVFNDATGGFGFWNENGGGQLQIATRAGVTVLSAGTTLTANTWNHIVAVRSGTGANQTSIFVNGSRVANGTDATNYTITGPLKIGGISLSNFYVNGYLSNVRIVKGSAVYDPTQTSITVPTAPFTAITNTQLLLNYTNAGITDATAKNDLETVGNAQISTSVSKFGGGSIAFDGTGDYLITDNSDNILGFGTGDWTIEFWLRLNSTGTQVIFDGRRSSASDVAPLVYYSSGLKYYTVGGDRISGGTLSTGVWYYIAIVKSSGSTRMYIDGSQTGSTYTDGNNYIQQSQRPIIGAEGVSVGANPLNGYIDDLRITKGYARTVTTVPTAPFSVQ